MKAKACAEWDDVLSAASRLQGIIEGTVLVGGTAVAVFAKHRVSTDADHVVNHLALKDEACKSQIIRG